METMEDEVEDSSEEVTQMANVQDESVHTQEEAIQKPEKIRGPRKPFGESMLSRFKGFFENDEAVN
jgi:hypothetical protein